MGFLPNVQNFINCIGNNDDFVCFAVQKRGKGCFCSYILKDDVGLAGCNSVWASRYKILAMSLHLRDIVDGGCN